MMEFLSGFLLGWLIAGSIHFATVWDKVLTNWAERASKNYMDAIEQFVEMDKNARRS